MAIEIKTGTYTGTGAAITFQLGFVPDYIRVINTTDGDEAWEWFNGMTDGHALYQRSVTDNATTGNASMSRITSNGVTASNPTDFTNKKGFTVGTALSESTKVFGYIAVRNAEY